MKRNLLVFTAALLIPVLTVITFKCIAGKQSTPKKHTISKCIKITLVDSVDGRPVYEVVLPNSRKIEAMYGEEIGNGLATGDWLYNEDYKITTAN